MFVSPSKAKEMVTTCMKAGLVPWIQSSPGIGKSSIVKQIADEYGLQLIDLRLSSLEPTDLMGLPWIKDGKASFQTFDFFPTEDCPIPQGKEGFLLFLDEFNSASRATQAAAYRVVLDREVGQKKLHPRCMVVAAGNLMTDGAITNQMSTAMMSRVIHIFIEVNFDDWKFDYAIPNKVDERIIAYLSMYPDKLMSFNPERDNETFACPRTWSFLDNLIKANNNRVSEEDLALYSGAITVEQASAFIQFTKIYEDLISIDDILKNPDIEPPTDNPALWATITHLALHTTKDNFDSLYEFLKKLPPTFQVVYLRNVIKTVNGLVSNPKCTEMVKTFGKYFLGD